MIRSILSVLVLFSSLSSLAFTPVHNSKIARGKNTSGGPVVYYGGPVISAVKLYAVFWTAAVDKTTQAKIGPFYDALANSSYIDMLKQYGTKDQTIGRGSFGGVITLKPINTSKSLDQKDVEAEIIAQLDKGVLPKPDGNTLFMIHFPQGYRITAFGGASCSTWCADHEGIKNHPKYGNVAYAMMPDMGGACAFGCGSNGTFGNLTVSASHEIAEAITDPMSPAAGQQNAFPAAWLSPDQNEIGDLCVKGISTLSSKAASYPVQDEYDNSIRGCRHAKFSSSK